MSHVDVDRLLVESKTVVPDTTKAEPLRDPLVSEASTDPLEAAAPTTALSARERRTLAGIAQKNAAVPPKDNRQRYTLTQLLQRATEDDFRALRRDFKRAGLDLKAVLKGWSKARTYAESHAVYQDAYKRCLEALEYKSKEESIEELRSQSLQPRADVERLLTPRERIGYRMKLIGKMQRLHAAETDPAKAKAIRDEYSALLEETLKMDAEYKKQRSTSGK